MKKYNLLLLCFLTVGVLFGQTSNNLLPIEDWVEGQGTLPGWSSYGSTAANSRQETLGPEGKPVLAWHCLSVPGEGAANGGFSKTLNVDPDKTYRYSVWVRRNDSNSGLTYFRAYGGNSTYNLAGNSGGVSQFWSGDLPTIGDWYLLVGYIHKQTHSETVHHSGVYDTKGNKVANAFDYKWQPTATISAIFPFYNSGAANESQDFYAPRVEVINGNEPSLMTLTEMPAEPEPQSGNLLTPKDWNEGTGSVGQFVMMNSDNENSRVLGTDPRGESSMIWTAMDDGSGGTDGGFYSQWSAIDPSKTYRFVQWLRKKGSVTNGISYFGAGSGSNATTPTLTLGGTPSSGGYFFAGDVPEIDKWYMMVAYVHGSSYTGTVSMGGIYDGETGKKVLGMTDFKNKPDATQQRLRTFLHIAAPGTSQDVWGVRMEMVDGNEPTIDALLSIDQTEISGNLLPIEDWDIGTGPVSIFSQNGNTNENVRDLGIDPHGESSVIWTGLASGNSSGDGGWNANFSVDHTKSYRFSVWAKRSAPSVGNTYLGAMNGSGGQTLNLSGTPNSNPYFWYGDLPEVDKWYLIVGYVHGSGYTATTSIGKGGVYDGETGEKVLNAFTDFKNSVSTTTQRHRTYLYYSTTAGDTQEMWGARAEMIDGNEPTLEDLLSIDNGPHIWSEITNGAVYNSGSVGIGVDDNDMDTAYKLLVDGDIKTRKVKVTLDGWADYVFDPSYALPPLADVESYIKENGHLPGIPSEEEVMEEGIYLGDTDVMLLKKIEELTLYVIELEKKLKALEESK